MVGLDMTMGLQGLPRVQEALAAFGPADRREVLGIMGGVAESAVRRRLSEDKESPEGDPWPAWSEQYARTRHGNQSLLLSEGHLIDSLQSVVTGDDTVLVGSPLVYAAIHQFGGEPVGMSNPARAYMGLSADDEAEMLQAVERFVWGRLHG